MRKKEGNKERDIVEAAIKVFAEKGYHNSKVHKIAEVAGIATGSVYIYFENKEMILLRIFEDLWRKLYAALEEIADRDDLTPVQKFEGLIDVIFDYFTVNPEQAIVFVNEQSLLMYTNRKEFTKYYDKFLDLGEKIVRMGVKEKYFNKNLDITIVRYFVFGGIRHLVRNWAHSPKDFNLNHIRLNVKDMLKNGLLA
ncbi:MAG TPA: TetR/AcrR family transcriptional regulator [Ignavibacteriales bacterium]|nr:TetR/AcrR family transcriptional regulator [Ignavibacteriales bacterium]